MQMPFAYRLGYFMVSHLITGVGNTLSHSLPVGKMLCKDPGMSGRMVTVVQLLEKDLQSDDPTLKTAKKTRDHWQKINETGAFEAVQTGRIVRFLFASVAAVAGAAVIVPFVQVAGLTATGVCCVILLINVVHKLLILVLSIFSEERAEALENIDVYSFSLLLCLLYQRYLKGMTNAPINNVALSLSYAILATLVMRLINARFAVQFKKDLPALFQRPPLRDDLEWLRANLVQLQDNKEPNYKQIKDEAAKVLSRDTNGWFQLYVEKLEKSREPVKQVEPVKLEQPVKLEEDTVKQVEPVKLEEEPVKLEEEPVKLEEPKKLDSSSQTLNNLD